MTELDPEFCHIADNEFVRYCRRELPAHASELMSFLVVDQDPQVWVVASWLNRDKGQVQELASYTVTDGPNRDTFDTVRFNLMPHRKAAHLRAWLQSLFERDRNIAERQRERAWRRTQRREYLRSKASIHQRDNPAWKLI